MNEIELDTLKKDLKSENYHVRRAAIQKLKHERTSQKTISVLSEALTDSDNYVRVLAAEAIAKIDPDFKQACDFTVVKTLIDIVASKEEELVDNEEDDPDFSDLTISESAAYVLSDISFLASNAAPKLLQLFTNSDTKYRKAVYCALSSMLYRNKAAFIHALANKNRLIRLGAIDVLSTLEEDEGLYQEMEAVVPALAKASEDDDEEVREAASKLLKSLKSFSA